MAPMVADALARFGGNQAQLQLDWEAAKKNVATLNAPQQVRILQSSHTAQEAIKNIEDLYGEWNKLGGASGYKVFNKAALAASKQVPGRLGEVAQALEQNIADVTEALATIYQGGNSPTQESFELAKKTFGPDWNPGQMAEGIRQAKKNIGFRINAMAAVGPQGRGGANAYTGGGAAEKPPEASAATAGPKKIASDAEYDALPSGAEFIDPDGKRRRKP
jgi:hypothetical protein